MAQGADIKVLIGPKGGNSPSGSSAVKIRQELQAALSGKNGVKVNVRLTSNAANNLRQEIQKALNANGGIEVKLKGQISGAVSKAVSGSTKQISDEVAARKIQDGIERTIINRRKEARKQDLAQSKAINKALDEQYKLQQKAADEEAKAADAAKRAADNEQKKAAAAKQTAIAVRASAAFNVQNFEKYLQGVSAKGRMEYAGQINQVRELYRVAQENGLRESLLSADSAARQLKATFKDLGYEGGNIFTFIQNKVKSFMVYLVSSKLMNTLIQGFQDATQAVIELNKAMVDLRMVTGGSVAQAEQLVKQYNQMAQELGVTTAAITEAAVEWQRQGYSAKDTETLIRNSTILAKVGFLDAVEAQQYLTSMMKGYQISVGDSISIVDKLAAVDASAAVSAGGLAEAISKTANSARLAGVDLDTLIGYLAAVGEVTQQDMSSLGNAFKTLFARYSNVKLGKLEDDEGESLNDYETVLKTIGISLRNAQGEFRDFGEVFDEVVAKWGSIDNITKSAIAQALGSTRQREGVLTLLDNIDNAAKYTEISLSSAGNAVQKFESYGEGLEAKAATMKASFEELASTLLDSDILGLLYDIGNAVLNAVSAFDAWPAKIALIAAGLPTLIGLFNELKNMPLITSIGKSFKDLARPKMTGRNWNWANHLEEAA